MENQHHDDHNYRHDHTEEEFSTANPNTNEPEQPIAPKLLGEGKPAPRHRSQPLQKFP